MLQGSRIFVDFSYVWLSMLENAKNSGCFQQSTADTRNLLEEKKVPWFFKLLLFQRPT